MALATIITDYLGSLLSVIGVDGKILPDQEELASSFMSNISEICSIDMGIDIEGYVTVAGISYPDTSQIAAAVEEASTSSTLTNYFTLGSDYEFDVVNATGGQRLATVIMAAAANVEFTYTEDTENKVHILENSNFTIRIYELNTEVTPIQYPNITISCGLNKWTEVSVFDIDHIRKWYPQYRNLRYQVIQLSGEALIKCYCNDDSSAFDADTAEELFEDVSINQYTTADSGVLHNINNHKTNASFGNGYVGGFAIISMYDNATDAEWSAEDLWACLFMSTNGAPLFTAMTLDGTDEADYLNPLTFAPTVTGNADTKYHLAPIYCPASVLYSSRNARWAIMRNANGIFALTSGFYRYRCDYGLCMRE